METSARKSHAWLVVKMDMPVSPAWHVTKLSRLQTCKITAVHTTLRHEACSNSYCGSFATPLTLIHFKAICNLLLLLLFDNYVHVNAYCREISTVRCKTQILQSNRESCWQYRFSVNYGMIPILLRESMVQPNFHVALLTYNISKSSTYIQNILPSHDYIL